MSKRRTISASLEPGYRQESNTCLYPPSSEDMKVSSEIEISSEKVSPSPKAMGFLIDSVGGMSCSACVNAIKSNLSSQPEIFKASVSCLSEK